MLRCFFCSCLLAALVPIGFAAELVVNGPHEAASDGNPGTPERPLKTILAAATRVKPGDTVLIHGGEYRETVIVTTSGAENAPIVFEAAPGETPVIKGSDVIKDWQRDSEDVWKTTLPATQPPTSDADDPAFWRTNDVRQVFTRDGVFLDAERLTRVAARDQMKAGTFFCDKGKSTLYVWLADSGSPGEHPPEVSLRGAWLRVNASNVTVRGLAMRHASTTAIAPWPACILTGENITMEDCVITWGDFVGASITGKRHRFRRNVLACHGAAGMGGTGEEHLIEGCRFIYNNVDRYDPEWHAGGAKLIPSFKRGTIRNNEFAHNLGQGLWLDDRCDHNLIDGNYSHDNEGVGIMVEISAGNVISNNISTANQNHRSGLYRDGEGKEKQVLWSEPRVAPSRYLNIYHAGDGRGIYVSSAPDTKVLHNTVYANEAEGICVEGPPRETEGGTMTTRGSVVRNNIIVFNHGSQLTITTADAGEASGTRSDYNLLFSLGALLAKKGWAGPAALSLKEWQTASGQDAHSIDADPRFAAAAMGDFHLLEESPGLQTGKPLAEVKTDYFGRPRDTTKATLGACEANPRKYPMPVWPKEMPPRSDTP